MKVKNLIKISLSTFLLSFFLVGAISIADVGAPSGAISATYDVETQTLSISGSYSNAPSTDKKRPGYAIFIDGNTPNTSSIDSVVHTLPQSESGDFDDEHSLTSAPSNVCVAIYDLEIDENGDPKKTTGGHSTKPAGSDHNDDNSWDKSAKNDDNKTFGQEGCVIPEIVGGENQTTTIQVTKIVCDIEADLPNWGTGGPDIVSDTAFNFLNSHSNCHEEDWTFEWALDGTENPGDQTEVGGSDWTTFSGSVEVPAGALIWVREQFDNDYIPFTGANTSDDISAELYCHTDVLNYDNYDWINPVEAGETYYCIGFNVLVDDGGEEPPVSNSCPLPESNGDTTTETVNDGGEKTVQKILDDAGYSLNAQTDQKQYQTWEVSANSEVIVDATFLDGISARTSVFGYYTNGSTSNFVPIFKTANIVGFEGVPMSNTGPFTVNTGAATTIGFAMKYFSGNNQLGISATENSLSTGGDDMAVVYNPSANKYIIAFEDWVNGDFDYNDLVVEVVLSCSNLEAENVSPTADAGPDQVITLPTNSVNLDGSGSTDPDGTIASYVWTFVSGPSNVDPNDTVSPSVSGLQEGTYIFKLTVTDDDGATDEDTVSITVNPEPTGGDDPQCSDGIDNDDPEDELVDANDPGCHTDGNANNPDSYNPNDDDETDEVSGPTYICSDGLDNDGDGKIDADDPGCHNPTSGDYDPFHISEVDVVKQPSGGGGISGGRRGGGGGQVLGVGTSCGIYVEKYLRIGHANNVEAVIKVQTFLNNYMNAGLVVDGIYGPLTEAAVKNFQRTHANKILVPWGISEPTGIFYLTTQTEVNNIMCPELGLPIPSNLVNFSQNPTVTPPFIPNFTAPPAINLNI